MVKHFKSRKERLDFVRGKFTEIKPIEVKEEVKEPKDEPKDEKPKAKSKPKAKKEVKK